MFETLELMIVPDSMCPADILIGNGFISQPQITFYKNGNNLKFVSCVNLLKNSKTLQLLPIRSDQISCHEKETEVLELLNKHRDCIATNLGEMGKISTTQMEIKVISPTPVVYNYNPYRLSESQRSKVKEIVNDLFQHYQFN